MPKPKSNILWQVQFHFYSLLKKNKRLAKSKVQIFHQIPKDTPFPYIYLGKFSVVDTSSKTNSRANLINEVHLYSQDHSLKEILDWEQEARKSLCQRDIFLLPSCHIGAVQFLQMELDIMRDSRTYRVISKFRTLIEEIYGDDASKKLSYKNSEVA